MAWFGKRKTPRTPAWARTLGNRARFDAWLDTVVAVLETEGIDSDRSMLSSGSVIVAGMEIALQEIADGCADLPEEEWATYVRMELHALGLVTTAPDTAKPESRHTFSIFRGGEEVQRIDLEHGPFDSDIAPLLKLQMFARGSALDVVDRGSLVVEKLAEGLWACLVLDFGSHEVTVQASSLATWKRSRDEVWARAIDNLLLQDIATIEHDGDFEVIAGNGSFVAAAALALDRLDAKAGRAEPAHGYVVAVPNWHALIARRCDTPPNTADLAPMAEMARTLFNYTDPVSPDLYELRAGRWRRLPV